MHSVTQILALLGLLQTGLAVPHALPDRPPPGPFQTCHEPRYEVGSHKDEDKPPILVSGYEVKGCPSGCELSKEVSLEMGVEVSVGLDLGLDFSKATAGIGASVAISTVKGEAFTSTIGCPADSYCKLMVIHHMERVEGLRHLDGPPGPEACDKFTKPYNLLLPKLIDGEGEMKTGSATYSACFSRQPPKPVEGYDYPDCPPA